MQKTQEKRANHLLAPDPEGGRVETELGKLKLTPEEYGRLLSWWQEKGWFRWLGANETTKGWRADFLAKMNADRGQWKEMILKGARRVGWSTRENIRHWLSTADGDPLMFLNLAGVSPLAILCELEYWKIQNDNLDRLRQSFRPKLVLGRDLGDLKKAATLLDEYKPLLDAYANFARVASQRTLGYTPLTVPAKMPDRESIMAVVEIAEEAKRIGLLPPGAANRGGPPHVELPALARRLMSIIMITVVVIQQLQEFDDQEVKQRVEICFRSYWGAITSILIAAFPRWVKQDKDPIRNVKNAYKSKPFIGAYRWWYNVATRRPVEGHTPFTFAPIVLPDYPSKSSPISLRRIRKRSKRTRK